MNGGIIPLTTMDLAIAGVLVAAAGVISLLMGLGLERRLTVAAVRTVVQLLLIGYILKWVFAVDHPWVLAPVLTIMTGAAAHAAVRRPSHAYSGVLWRVCAMLILCGLLTTFTVTQLIIRVTPWYDARYIIPLLGMVLGNALTGIALSLDQVLEQFKGKQALIEMELAHGATRWEAARDVLADAIRRGMIPIINAMMVVGVVSLPGMMTGQILAGANPLEAVKYQIVVMFMIAAATSLGCMGVALLSYHRLFNTRHQLLVELIIPQNK
jgi:putative ABC transport system permease protein